MRTLGCRTREFPATHPGGAGSIAERYGNSGNESAALGAPYGSSIRTDNHDTETPGIPSMTTAPDLYDSNPMKPTKPVPNADWNPRPAGRLHPKSHPPIIAAAK